MITTIVSILVFVTSGTINEESCTTFMEFACKEIYPDSEGWLVLVLQNATGQRITINPFTGIALDGKTGYATIVKDGARYEYEPVEIGPMDVFAIEGFGSAFAAKLRCGGIRNFVVNQ